MSYRKLGVSILLLPAAVLLGANLEKPTCQAWDDYVRAVKARVEQRGIGGKPFLLLDEQPEQLAAVRAGGTAVWPAAQQIPKPVPSGLIHDWVGAIFVPGAHLKNVLQVVRDYPRYKQFFQPVVIDAALKDSAPAMDRFSMLLMNKSFFARTVLDADYESSFVSLDEHRVYCLSHTTRIRQIDDYGAPDQHTLPEDKGTGIIWRLFSVTRFAERDGGVYIEIEAIGLSRDIPSSVRWFVDPIVRRVSRSSLTTSLRQTEDAVLSPR
jgi:hypothetical protein